jgi:hypothetical protein
MNSPSGTKAVDNAGPIRTAAGWFAHLASRMIPKKAEPAPRRLLFLDDDPRRAEIFLAEHPQAVWVETVAACVSRLEENWDEVHLDHDLGGNQMVEVDNVDCGMQVVRWMCKEPRDHLRSTLFFVHTHNLVAGLLMVMQMRSAGFAAEFQPFGQDLAKMLAHNEPDNGQAEPGGAGEHPLRRWLNWLRVLDSFRRGR